MRASKKEHIPQREATERGVGSEKADIDEYASRRPYEEGGIGQRRDESQQQRSGYVYDQKVVGPAFPKPTLYARTESKARESPAKATAEDGNHASAC